MPPRRADRWLIIGLIGVGVLLPALVALIGGTFSLPHLDDIAYRRPADSLFESGSIRLTGWSAMNLVGQLVFALPFQWLAGGAPWAFAASSLTLGAAGLAAGYVLARWLLPPVSAALAVLMLVATPGFVRNVSTFMTDIPALSLELLCLAAGAVAVTRPAARGRWPWLAASLVIGLLGFAIREYALAAPAAVLAATFMSDDRRRWAPYVACGAAVLVASIVIALFARSLPGFWSVSLVPGQALNRVLNGIATLAFFVLPAMILWLHRSLGGWRREGWIGAIRTRPVVAAGVAAGLLVAAVLWGDDLGTIARGRIEDVRVLIGTIFGRPGEPDGQMLAGARPPLFSNALWRLLNLVAVGAGFLLLAILGGVLPGRIGAAVRSIDPRRRPTGLGTVPGMVGAFVVLYAVGVAALASSSLMFDRYLWPLVVPVATLFLWHRPAEARAEGARPEIARPGPILAGAVLAASGVITVALLLNSVAFDAARWQIGEAEMARGLPAMSIDAGFEWLGEHATSDTARVHLPFPDNATRYSRLWASYRQCVVVSSSRLRWPGLELAEVRQQGYRNYLWRGAWLPLYIYRSPAPECQPGSPDS